MTSNTSIHSGRWWEKDGQKIQCNLCPRHCRIKPGNRGFCFVRKATTTGIELTTYGRSSGFCIDPIEKKPLNHFFPGSSVLSFGTAGCNLACKFCQNWDISKSKEMDKLMQLASPEVIARAANQLGCSSVAFTYNDPVIFAEYAIDVANACRELGIHSVAVTAGYITEEARSEFFNSMDATNVDLKAFTKQFYRNLCGSDIEPVKETLKYLVHETNIWVELTNLIIPGENDNEKELRELSKWIRDELTPTVPIHFTAYHPAYKLSNPRTPTQTLLNAQKIALEEGLEFVYTGNVHNKSGESTYCPNCGNLLIGRNRYELSEWSFAKESPGVCPKCEREIPGHFNSSPGTWGQKRVPIDIANFTSSFNNNDLKRNKEDNLNGYINNLDKKNCEIVKRAIREPAVAGSFYSENTKSLFETLSNLFSASLPKAEAGNPKALIVPHAGYMYSGQIAANAFSNWINEKDLIENVVIIGPSHRVLFDGIAIPKMNIFKTPLGEVSLKNSFIEQLKNLPQVIIDDEPHRQEHSIEVQIPFLQKILGNFKILPLAVGRTSGEKVAEIIELLWGQENTRFVISSDLSHYKEYNTAQKIDEHTAKAIERMDYASINSHQACGCIPIAGMLIVAQKKDLNIKRISLLNSGDICKNKKNVVGYGAWSLAEKTIPNKKEISLSDLDLLKKECRTIFSIAAKTIEYSTSSHKLPNVDIKSFSPYLQKNRATFVTINKNGKLRGCVGSIHPTEPFIVNVVNNAYKAALKDPRFSQLKVDELSNIEIIISLLSDLQKMSIIDEQDLLNQMKPNIDGLLIKDGRKQSVFLPQVWNEIPNKVDFIASLKQKAGLASNHWSLNFQAWKFTVNFIKGNLSK